MSRLLLLASLMMKTAIQKSAVEKRNQQVCITHEESYLQTVLADGEPDEIAESQNWYNEAKARNTKLGY